MGLRFEWIPEEHEHVNASFSDHRSDLLISTHRSAVETSDIETKFVDQHPAGGACCPQSAGGEFPEMAGCPIEQFGLLVVMGDQSKSRSIRIR